MNGQKKKAAEAARFLRLRLIQRTLDVGDGFVEPRAGVGNAVGEVHIEIAAENAEEEVDDLLDDLEYKAHFELIEVDREYKAFIVDDGSGGAFPIGVADHGGGFGVVRRVLGEYGHGHGGEHHKDRHKDCEYFFHCVFASEKIKFYG